MASRRSYVADYGKDAAGDATHWIVKGGERVAILEMDDVHLLNVVAYLQKKHLRSLDEQAGAFAVAGSFGGDSMARYYADQAADEVRVYPPADSHPAYGGLRKEITRRGLQHMLEIFLRQMSRRGS